MAVTGITGMGQLAITVAELDRAVAFYRDVLGFRVLIDLPEQRMAFLAGAGVRLYLDGNPNPEHESSPITYWTVDDLDAAEAALRDAGAEIVSSAHLVHRTEASELWMCFTRDPDDNPVALMQERPAAPPT